MPNEHIVSAYDKELESLREIIARMGGIAESQIADAVDVLYKRDREAAKIVIAADKQLDDLEMQLEHDAITILAKRQPMAADLRAIVSALKMSADIERIGDYAKNIAKRVEAISTGEIRIVRTIGNMALLVQKMLKDLLDAYVDNDADKAFDVWSRDEAVDELNNSMFRELLTYMMEDPREITAATHLLFVSKNIERMGDHVTNMAEIVYYLVKGEVLADDRPKNDMSSYTVVGNES
jgi:phosphate transport system protein